MNFRPTILLSLLLLLISITRGSDINVAPGPGKPIHEALAKANPFDIIIIQEGIYKEGNIIVDKPVTLIAHGNVVIDGENANEIFTVVSNSVNIIGLQLRNTGYSSMNDLAAVKLLSVSKCRIENNTIVNACYGIYLLNSSNCVVKNNNLNASGISQQRSGNGIHAWQSDSITVEHNTVSGHRDGIYFEFVTCAGVYKNTSRGNLRYGIHFMFSNNDEYIDNLFSNNGSGVAVMFSKFVNMRGNTFELSKGGAAYGILLKEMNDCRIEKNSFKYNTNGVYAEGCNRICITQNIFKSNGWAMKMQASCVNVTITKNNFLSNTFDVATNGTLSLNDFNYNYWDKYEGYDLDKNGIGDVPFNPVNLYSVIVERMPYALILYRSFMVTLLDKSEKMIPSIATESLRDQYPYMKAVEI